MIQAVTLDAYNTMLTLISPFRVMQGELAELGYEISLETVTNAFREEMEFYKAHHLEADTPGNLEILRDRGAELIFQFLEKSGVEIGLSVKEQSAILERSIRFQLFDDVIPALEQLSTMSVKLGVVSNWDCGLPSVLNEFGLDHYFEVITVSAIEGIQKPDTGIFIRTAEKLEVLPERILHIGDQFDDDVEGSRNAGMDGLLISRDGIEDEYDCIVIRSLKDICSFVEKSA